MVFRYFLPVILFVLGSYGYAQQKQEQEFGIDEKDLPRNISPLLSEYLKDVKRLRFFKELDGQKTSYEVKFKKDTLYYSIEFDSIGQLEDVEFIIKESAIPKKSYASINEYLGTAHEKYRIKKIQQQYPHEGGNAKALLRDAFQNLLSTKINYELIIATKDKEGYVEFEITFDAQGNHLLTRKSVATKYDHVLFE